MDLGDRAAGLRFLVRDRAGQFTASFDAVLAGAAIGHADPAFTLRLYAHLLPSSHARARTVINERFTRMITLPPSLDA